MSMSSLTEYQRKRHLRRSGEPAARKASSKGARRFVIQKHDATRLHYDFRLEADGVLHSWAVPRGPSTDPREKRLALPTEDHPLEYADFEGVIPKGEYGAGTVIVWDAGRYRNMVEEDDRRVPIEQQIDDGHVKVWLEGKKLAGGYVLQRTGHSRDGRWLLVKVDDDKADRRRNPVSTEPESVLSGRTNDDLARDRESAAAGDDR